MNIYCPHCDRIIPSDSKLCAYCGRPLPYGHKPITAAGPPQKSKSDTIILIVLLIVVIVIIATIAIAATVYVYVSGMFSPTPIFDSESASVTVLASDEGYIEIMLVDIGDNYNNGYNDAKILIYGTEVKNLYTIYP